ncbi:MAG: hypothetical protein II229_05005 [Clostridia bacterium]|nr:hypothetical protein [Clostridia bacterium]
MKVNPTQYDTPIAPRKLSLLVTVVNRAKAEFYMDLLQSFEVNFQTAMAARGTASAETLRYLGLTESDKTVIFSVIREDMVPRALSTLEEKFKTIKNGKGIAYTVPMTGTIGVAIYQFLSNTPSQ